MTVAYFDQVLSLATIPNLLSFWEADAIVGQSDGATSFTVPDQGVANKTLSVTGAPVYKTNGFYGGPGVSMTGGTGLTATTYSKFNGLLGYTVFSVFEGYTATPSSSGENIFYASTSGGVTLIQSGLVAQGVDANFKFLATGSGGITQQTQIYGARVSDTGSSFSNPYGGKYLNDTPCILTQNWNSSLTQITLYRNANQELQITNYTPNSVTAGTAMNTASSTIKIGYGNGNFTGMWRATIVCGDMDPAQIRATIAFLQDRYFKVGTGTGNTSIALNQPTSRQVFQRSGTTGTIQIAGTYTGNPTNIEASWNGGGFTAIQSGLANMTSGAIGYFSGSLAAQAQGSGDLTVRFSGDHTKQFVARKVGIGDVWVVAGQSNGEGRGSALQSYTGSVDMSMLGADGRFRGLGDPFGRSVDALYQFGEPTANAPGGSVWPWVANQFAATNSFPLCFVFCCRGNTGLYFGAGGSNDAYGTPSWILSGQVLPTNHQDVWTYYGSLVATAKALPGGVKGVIWWQGESDAAAAVSTAHYQTALGTLANAINADLGVKLLPCLFQLYADPPGSIPDSPGAVNIRAAITALSPGGGSPNANIVAGADISNMTADDSIGVHLASTTQLKNAAAGDVNAFGGTVPTRSHWTALKNAASYA